MSLRDACWVTVLGLILAGSFALSPAAAQAPDIPPVIPVDIRPDPSFENVSHDTEEVSFEVQLYRWDDTFTGDYDLTVTDDDDLIAAIGGFWEPGATYKNVSTVDDADDGPGVWEPTIGVHQLNFTTEARGESFPIPLTVPMGPDLRPTSVEMDPEHPLPGDEVTFTLEVQNQGTWETPPGATIPVSLTVDETALGEQTIEDLDSSETTTLTFDETWTAREGTHDVTATVAPVIEEVRDENNELLEEIQIDAHGLSVTSLTADPHPAEPDETVTVTAKIENKADREADAEPVVLYQNGERVGETETAPLDPGEADTVTWETQASTGLHELQAVIDPGDGDQIPEDATGRTYELSVGPDFRLANLDVSERQPVEGDNVTLTVTVHNHGTNTSQTVPVVLYLLEEGHDDEAPLDAAEIDGLDAGGQATVTFEMTPPVGEHRLIAHVDPVEDIQEASREDNRAEVPLTVRPDAPLPRVYGLALEDPDVEPGEETRIEATIRNEGSQPARDLHARFLLDGEPLDGTHPIERVLPGDQVTVTSPAWTTGDGLHALTVQIGNQTQLERDDPEDTGSRDVLVEPAGPSLILEDLRTEPEAPANGDQTRLVVTVTNQGDRTREDIQVLFLADDEELSSQTLDELEPGASADVTSEAWTLGDEPVDVTASLGDEPTDEQAQAGQAVHATVSADASTPVPLPGLAAVAATLIAAGASGRRRA